MRTLSIVLFLANIFLLCAISNAQDIRIYHGQSSASTIFFLGEGELVTRWSGNHEIVKDPGESVEIVVLNPNPLLYSYDFELEELQEEDDFPDVVDLVSAINALPNFAGGAAPNSFRPAGGGAISGGLNIYFQALTDLKTDLDAAKVAILNSDAPESKVDALTGAIAGGYRLAVATIDGLSGRRSGEQGRFNSTTLQADLDGFLNAAVQDGTLKTAMANDDNATKFAKDAFALLNKQLAGTVAEIKKSIEADPLVRTIIPVKEKNIEVTLKVKKKDGNSAGRRMEIDMVICTIKPRFDRRRLEVVPLAHLTYANDVPEFSVVDGKVVEGRSDGFQFKVGAMLLYNFVSFGKYRDGALGVGLGYNIPEKNVLETFYLGTLVSYKKVFRIGYGIGFTGYPHSLKSGAVGEPLPADVKDLDSIIQYDRKLASFITFSISGITLKK